MLSCGLSCFLVLLGALRALMLPVLAGGVSGAEAAITGLGLVNSLLVALAAGLWMSALFRERNHAFAATLGLLTAVSIGPELVGTSVFGPAAAPVFRLFGLSGWMTAGRMTPVPTPGFLSLLLHYLGLFQLRFLLW